MPTYVYQCSNSSCENHQSFELVQKITEPALKKCPICEAGVERLLTGGAFHLKGSGWYKTDYASSSNGSTSSKPKATEKKSEEKASESSSAASDTTTKKETSGGGSCGGGCSCH